MNFTVITADAAKISETMDLAMKWDGNAVAFWIVEGDDNENIIVLGQIYRMREQ